MWRLSGPGSPGRRHTRCAGPPAPANAPPCPSWAQQTCSRDETVAEHAAKGCAEATPSSRAAAWQAARIPLPFQAPASKANCSSVLFSHARHPPSTRGPHEDAIRDRDAEGPPSSHHTVLPDMPVPRKGSGGTSAPRMPLQRPHAQTTGRPQGWLSRRSCRPARHDHALVNIFFRSSPKSR